MRFDIIAVCTIITVLALAFGIVTDSFTHSHNKVAIAVPVQLAESVEPVFATPIPTPVELTQLHCLAKNIYHEARGESLDGQLAVAHVTLNRVNHKRFPDTVCGVVKQAKMSAWWAETHNRAVPIKYKCQFSWYCDGRPDTITDQAAWRESVDLSLAVVKGETHDPTSGATHYFNPGLADPYWQDHYTKVASVDNHDFFK